MSVVRACDNCQHTSNFDWSSCAVGRIVWRKVVIDEEEYDFCSDSCETEYKEEWDDEI